jgi:hypothetical protein
MEFNPEKGVYEKALYLKQGYYNYSYVTLTDRKDAPATYENTEGNYWGTENGLIIAFGGRSDDRVLTQSTFQR